jgi:hypothetical protein
MEAEFVDCTFSGKMNKGWFHGTVSDEQMRKALGRDRNEIRGNDFSGMELIDVAFRTGVDLTQQRLPTSPEYVFLLDARASLDEAAELVTRWSDATHSLPVLKNLNSLASGLAGGQAQLLLRQRGGDNADAKAWNDALKVLKTALL